jgi:hypothetical protein
MNDDKSRNCNYLGLGDYSPEKAGVGGSTPSRATIIPNDFGVFPDVSPRFSDPNTEVAECC